MHDPDLLLLDEPYTGFDWETFQAFWDLTETLRDRGVAIAIISHIISERDRFDVIFELHEGHLHREVVDEDDEPESRPTESETDCDRPDDSRGS
jgi:ABC-type multidrug transport system ATPase subunit